MKNVVHTETGVGCNWDAPYYLRVESVTPKEDGRGWAYGGGRPNGRGSGAGRLLNSGRNRFRTLTVEALEDGGFYERD